MNRDDEIFLIWAEIRSRHLDIDKLTEAIQEFEKEIERLKSRRAQADYEVRKYQRRLKDLGCQS